MAGFVSGTKTVSSTTTPERLSSTRRLVTGLVLRAKTTNTGLIYVDDSTADSSSSAPMEAGYVISWGATAPNTIALDMYDIWIDVAVNGEGLDWWAIDVL